MLLAVQQLLLGRMREPVASRGIPIGVFAINRVARMPTATRRVICEVLLERIRFYDYQLEGFVGSTPLMMLRRAAAPCTGTSGTLPCARARVG